MVDIIQEAARSCDLSAEKEVPGFIPGPPVFLRPPLPLLFRLWISPSGKEAGFDCTETIVEDRLVHYGSHLATIHTHNIGQTPIAWSAYCTLHSNTLPVLRTLSTCISRRSNVATEQRVDQRPHARISVDWWRRTSRQIRSCWTVAELPPETLCG